MKRAALATAESALAEKDQELSAAASALDAMTTDLGAARTYREQLDVERARAQGRLVAGQPGAAVDLARLRSECIAGDRAVQDAAGGQERARQALERVTHLRARAAQDVGVEHVRGLMAHRATLAAGVDALLGQLANVIQLYVEVSGETEGLARALAAPVPRPAAPNRGARRVMSVLYPILTSEFRYTLGRSEAVAVSDDEATQALRTRLDES